MKPIRVFVVDEHKPSRTLARRVIELTPGLTLAGEATSPFTIRKAVNDSKPDVLVLNPRSRLSKHFDSLSNTINLPTVHMPEPDKNDNWHSIELHKVQYTKYSAQLIQSIKSVAETFQSTRSRGSKNSLAKRSSSPHRDKDFSTEFTLRSEIRHTGFYPEAHPLIVIGAPGGDLDAMRVVLLALQSQPAGILIAQQVPASFDQHYMESLSSISMLPVLKATQGKHIEPGKILLAPSDHHIEVIKKRDRYCCRLSDCDDQPGRKPSLDLLFSSLAENAGSTGIGILLIGKGSEGSKGLSRLKQAGANILVQENDSPLSDRIASAAIMNGGEELIVPLNSIGTRVNQILSGCSAKVS